MCEVPLDRVSATPSTLCLGTYGDPGGMGVFWGQGNPVQGLLEIKERLIQTQHSLERSFRRSSSANFLHQMVFRTYSLIRKAPGFLSHFDLESFVLLPLLFTLPIEFLQPQVREDAQFVAPTGHVPHCRVQGSGFRVQG